MTGKLARIWRRLDHPSPTPQTDTPAAHSADPQAHADARRDFDRRMAAVGARVGARTVGNEELGPDLLDSLASVIEGSDMEERAQRSVTPENIQDLSPGEVFVFGSNASGAHGGGAARIAHRRFGAIWGQGDGLQGQSYAIDTMSGEAVMADAASRFILFAQAHPELTFLLTPIGCGIAGYKPHQVAPLFRGLPANVTTPAAFSPYL